MLYPTEDRNHPKHRRRVQGSVLSRERNRDLSAIINQNGRKRGDSTPRSIDFTEVGAATCKLCGNRLPRDKKCVLEWCVEMPQFLHKTGTLSLTLPLNFFSSHFPRTIQSECDSA